MISSFGAMMAIAFLVCNYLLKRDLKSIGQDPMIGEGITLRAVLGGIIGAKIYYLIENIATGKSADNINGLGSIIS